MASQRKSHTDKKKAIRYFDYNLLFILIFLLAFGLVMLYSASSYTAANDYGDSAHFLQLQLRNLGVGLVMLIFLAVCDYRIWKFYGRAIYLVSFLLCLAVMFVGTEANGSVRWLKIGPVMFQPSEIAKIAVILYMAMLLEKAYKMMNTLRGLVAASIRLLPIVGIVAIQNLSTALVILMIAFCMLFVASPKYLHFLVLIGVGALVAVISVSFASYRLGRITRWLHPETATADELYQTNQGLYAIGSGKLFGKGLGESIQKMGNVPENETDMIFSIICEELGLFGAVSVILLYILLLWRMMVIANNSRDLYGALIVSGIMSHIAIQVIMNIAVVTNTMPNTGVTLPFISYGGTSFSFLLAEMGLVLSVSKGIRLNEFE